MPEIVKTFRNKFIQFIKKKIVYKAKEEENNFYQLQLLFFISIVFPIGLYRSEE